MPEIKDTYDQRFYIKDGKPYVRVTEVLNVLDKGQGFNNWLATHGADAERIRNEAADSGTRIHKACEWLQKGNSLRKQCLLNDEVISEYSDEEWKKIIGFVNWVKEYKPKFIACEQTVYHDELMYAGTIDIICEINGEKYVVDIKTGNSLHDTYDLQLAAYCYAGGYQKYKRALLHLKSGTKSGFQLKKIESDMYDFDLFCSCLRIWNWRNPCRESKKVELPQELKLESI